MISNDFRLQNINGDVISTCKEFSKSHQKQLKAYIACMQMLELRTYVCATCAMLMGDKKFSTVLVRWEGNNSKRFDGTKEEILLSDSKISSSTNSYSMWFPTLDKTAVIEPSFDQLSVRNHIKYEFVGQVWSGSKNGWFLTICNHPYLEDYFMINNNHPVMDDFGSCVSV